MRHETYLRKFVCDTVNLNQSRIDTLKEKVDTIISFVEAQDNFNKIYIESCLQGSYAHKTIIKPVDGDDFDADLMVFVRDNPAWKPKDYIDTLYNCFKASPHYGGIVRKRTRCVTLDYAGDFHLDVVPCIRCDNFSNAGNESILNRRTNLKEPTNPAGYSDWFREKDQITNGHLKAVVRLFKYLRDHKTTFSAKSILLTTILASRVESPTDLPNDFSDLSTSLLTIFRRLDDYLQSHFSMPTITNPSLPLEDFNRHWDQSKYENFKDCIHKYRGWIDDAAAEEDRYESILKWRRIFGEDYAKEVKGEYTGNAANIVKREDISHRKPLQWQFMRVMEIGISASLYLEDGETCIGALKNDDSKLKHGTRIKFAADRRLKRGYEAHWQVVNTGQVARDANGLRGGFYEPSSYRWEYAQYTGTHWIECFIVHGGLCVGRSGRFYVNVA